MIVKQAYEENSPNVFAMLRIWKCDCAGQWRQPKQFRSEAMRFVLVVARRVLFAFTVILSGCGGGGGSGDGADLAGGIGGPTVQGRALTAGNNVQEIEPNNTSAQAQTLRQGQSIDGSAQTVDAAVMIAGLAVHDVYRITPSEPTQLFLIIASDAASDDLDLYVFEEKPGSPPALFAKSDDYESKIEFVELPAGRTFLVGITAYTGGSRYLLSADSPNFPAANAVRLMTHGAEFVPGEIIVKFKNGASALEKSSGLSALNAEVKKPLSDGSQLVRLGASSSVKTGSLVGVAAMGILEPKTRSANELAGLTLSSLYRLQRDPNIEYAELNYISRTYATTNDPLLPNQWHYGLINVPTAWNTTVGSPNVITAVLDSGILSDHPDFRGQLVPGFDFISDSRTAGDRDAMDTNPEDLGFRSSFHGTHVAGTIAAASNNSLGVAGIAFGTKLMPLRVLGVNGSGNLADIAEAIYYAAALPNSSGALPARRADVINLSLGSPAPSTLQSNAIRAATQQGVVVIAAAGNDNTSSPRYPAAYPEVISVAAVGPTKRKATYSNFGPTVDVAAPGGESSLDENRDSIGDGVISTMGFQNGSNIAYGYDIVQGTSMASPHVAGVIALMKSVNPSLGPRDVQDLIKGTHANAPGRVITTPLPDATIGAGLIDASLSVAVARSIPPYAAATGSQLALSAKVLGFEEYERVLPVLAQNIGTSQLNIFGIATDKSWLTVSRARGSAPLRFDVSVDRANLPAGTHTATITVNSDAAAGARSVALPVVVKVGAAPGDVGTLYVVMYDAFTGEPVDEAVTTRANGYQYALPSAGRQLPPGLYYIVAGTDRDQNGFICELEDACIDAAVPLELQANASVTGVDFSVGHYRTIVTGTGKTGVPNRTKRPERS